MGFLDSLFGADEAQDDIRRGATQSNAALDVGAGDARKSLARAEGQITSATGRARDSLATGRTDISTGRDAALDFLGADIDAGDTARTSLLAALGLSGVDAQRDFFGNFQNDPGFQASLDAGLEAVETSAAARGGLFSGGTAQSLFDFGQRNQLGAFQDRLDRLTGLSNLGSQARTNAAGVSTGTGTSLANLASQGAGIEVGQGDRLANVSSELANLDFGLGQLKANTATNSANAIADTRGTGLNNLLGLASAGLRAASGTDFSKVF